ncbi:hypothetical protein FB451DRAFT_1183909 [Mycena latifolia]|nr:hypothetical protein FB451DRAFT_1183909 [Mycena latifolia]
MPVVANSTQISLDSSPVKTHGIPEETSHRMLDLSKGFFGLPNAVKDSVYQAGPVRMNMGYRPVRDLNIDSSAQGDLLEGMSFKWKALDDTADTGNRWPAEVPALREGVLQYYEIWNRLAAMLYALIATAMGVEDTFFDDKTKNKISPLRLLHYPEQPEEIVASGRDFVLNHFDQANDHWAFADIHDSTSTARYCGPRVRSGVMRRPCQGRSSMTAIHYFVDGHLKSAKHRVISRPSGSRYSAPLFYLADFDVPLVVRVIFPTDRARFINYLFLYLSQSIPSFVTEETPLRYKAVSAGEQLARMVKAARINESE